MIDVRLLSEYIHKGECFAITSYCNSEYKLGILNNTIDSIKQYRLPIFLHAHYILPEEIQKKVDGYFYSADNPIFNRFNDFWGFTDGYKVDRNNWGITKGYKMIITEFDHYYTTFKGWDDLIKVLWDYERIHMINYDTNFYPELFELTRKINKSVFLQHNFFERDKLHIFLLYFCLNKKSYNFFRENITAQKYIDFWATVQTQFIPHPEEIVGSFIGNNDDFHIVPYTEVDHNRMLASDVSMDARVDWDNLGLIENTRIFVGELDGIANVLFYDVKKPIKINICTSHKLPVQPGSMMGGEIGGIISSYDIFNLNLPFKDIEKISIKIDDKLVNDDLIKKFIRLDGKIYII